MAPIEIWLCVSALGAKLSKDGNQWSFLWGENLQEGIAGFGDTIQEAALDFYRSVCNETISEHAYGDGYIKACEDYKSLPKIHGWVARNKEICGGRLSFFTKKPQRGTRSWLEPDTMEDLPYEGLPKDMFPEISWESEPVEVELLIRKV